MTPLEFLGFLAAGGIVTWLLQSAGLLKSVWEIHPLLEDLIECDLCLGFWVYLILGMLLRQAVFGLWLWWIEPVIVAAICTTLAHLIRAGWLARYSTTIIN